MSDNTKFEQLLDLLINEEKDKAEELFHDIVVEKSKEIYQGLIESESKDDEDEEVEEASEKDDEKEDEVSENFVDDFAEEESVEEVGGDATDDMMADIEADGTEEEGDMDDHHADMGGNEELEDRVVDLEDALDDLKAEFEAMMADKDGGEEGEMDMGDEEESEEAEGEEEEEDEEPKESFKEGAKQPKTAGETMREYVEKVSAPSNSEGSDNTKSPVAGNAKAPNDAKAHKIGGGEEKGGSAAKPKDMGKSFENEPGARAGDTFKKASAPKSAE